MHKLNVFILSLIHFNSSSGGYNPFIFYNQKSLPQTMQLYLQIIYIYIYVYIPANILNIIFPAHK